jgi:hypothetical protein
MNRTTIGVSKKTRDFLASLGTKNTTFDEIIQNLIKEARKNE